MSLQSKNSVENPSSKLSHQTAMGDLNAQDVRYLPHANGAYMNGWDETLSDFRIYVQVW